MVELPPVRLDNRDSETPQRPFFHEEQTRMKRDATQMPALQCAVFLFASALPISVRAESGNLYRDAVALWSFDAASRDKLADASGNGHHGRITPSR